jgi:hypothetical protein
MNERASLLVKAWLLRVDRLEQSDCAIVHSEYLKSPPWRYF